ncbi:MAG: MFS transporter [Candidatus Latescibacteria bacterium]|nr:MFS transporter [Candidatus Latescibacterota bacterium]
MSTPERRLLGLLAAHFALYGMAVTLVGATVPEIIRTFGWSYLDIGAVMAAGSAGYLSGCFSGGVLVRKAGPRRMLLGGLVLEGLGLGAFGSDPGLALNLGVLLLVGLGQGWAEVATNYCLVRLEKPGESRLMNLIHAGFTAGACLGPAGVGALLAGGAPWRLAYEGVALLLLGVALVILRLSFPFAPAAEAASSRRALGSLVRNPLLVLLGSVIFLYVGAEIGISSWIAEYYVEAFAVSTATGAYMVSVVWLGLLLGRLALSAGYRGRRQVPLLLGLTCLAALPLALALCSDSPWVAGGLFLVSGLGFSAVYPVVIALVGEQFTGEQSLAIGLVSGAGGVGALCFPFAMAAIAGHFGIAQSFWFCAATAWVMALAAGAVLAQSRRRRSQDQLLENSTSRSR